MDRIIPEGKERAFFQVLDAAQNSPSDGRTIEGVKSLRQAIMAFVERPAIAARKAVQAFTTKADFQTMITQNFETFRQTDNFDMIWEQVYKQVPLAPNRLFWEILDVDSGLEFQEVPEGAQVKVSRLTGSKVLGWVRKYGGALGWSQEVIMSQDIGLMQQMAEIFRERFWKDKANRHYALLAAEGLGNVDAYDTTGSNELEKDINTINKSAYALENATKDLGFGDTANAPLVLIASPKLRPRIMRALSTTFQDIPGMGTRVTSNVIPFFSFNPYLTSTSGSSNADHALLILPGRKIQRAEAMAPTSYTKEDIQSLATVQAVWSFYGAVIGRQSSSVASAQVRQVRFA